MVRLSGLRISTSAYVGVLPECMRGGDHTGHKAPRPSPGHGAYFLLKVRRNECDYDYVLQLAHFASVRV